MVLHKNARNIFLSLILIASANVFAMQDGDTNSSSTEQKSQPKTNIIKMMRDYVESFINGWGPTAATVGAAAWYTARKDLQAPQKLFSWSVKTFNETSWLLKGPAAILGACMVGEYYKPRFEATLSLLKEKMGYKQRS